MNISFLTKGDPDLDKKIGDGLHSELQTLSRIAVTDFKTHSIYAFSGVIFAGGIIIEKLGNILWIDSIWVDPKFRDKGIGRQLMLQTLSFADKNNIRQIQLNTFFPEAQSFFSNCGFKDLATIRDWKYGLECYLMRKML